VSQEFARHTFTVEEYELMGQTGVLPPDRRTELLEGEIFDMSPIGIAHAACVDFLNEYLTKISEGAFIVRCQNPVFLDDRSEPQPDITLLRRRDDRYRSARPTPADVLLLVEVADSSLGFDRQQKLPLYAKNGIPEVWIVNLSVEQVEVHAQPEESTYRLTQILRRGEIVEARSIEGVKIPVDDIFG
jgi:Uma2 family endonuclease